MYYASAILVDIDHIISNLKEAPNSLELVVTARSEVTDTESNSTVSLIFNYPYPTELSAVMGFVGACVMIILGCVVYFTIKLSYKKYLRNMRASMWTEDTDTHLTTVSGQQTHTTQSFDELHNHYTLSYG